MIDPIVTYSTYLGGNGDDQAYGVAADSAGNAYVTGATVSNSNSALPPNFPTRNAYQPDNNGGADTFVTKLNPAGTGLVYSTYLGGSGNDYGIGIAIDSTGNAYVTGYTNSRGASPTGFPTTTGAYQTDNKSTSGHNNAFVTKLNAAGTGLVYSTYLGGSNSDSAAAIAVDAAGNAYITGTATSSDFPTFPAVGAYDASVGGPQDAFVTKLNPAGTALLYSTYLSGGGFDEGRGIAVDTTGNAYDTGDTDSGVAPYSAPYPTTSGAYQQSYGGTAFDVGEYDVFVTKLNAAGTGLVYSTYLGKAGDDQAYGIAVDGSGNACVAGYTTSTNFPHTAGAYQTVHSADGGGRDAFVSKLNSAGTSLLYSTFLGGDGVDAATGIALDSSGNMYVAGSTTSSGASPTGFPTTTGAAQVNNAGGSDAFISIINPAQSGTPSLVYSTYFGGSGDEGANAIATDSSGNAYIAGGTSSTDFPTAAPAPGPYQANNATVADPSNPFANDAFVIKLSPSVPTAVKLISFTATRYTGVLWLNWQTGYEVDSLGFNVYREVGGKKVRLNGSTLIAGSALQGAGRGESYAWPDALTTPGMRYWLEDVDTNGTHTWHGPITPRGSSGSAAALRRSPLLGGTLPLE